MFYQYYQHSLLRLIGTEIWIWKQFNKTKPDLMQWNVTLSKDNYNLLIDAITTVARDTGINIGTFRKHSRKT